MFAADASGLPLWIRQRRPRNARAIVGGYQGIVDMQLPAAARQEVGQTIFFHAAQSAITGTSSDETGEHQRVD